jgi:hypothetical protein
MIEYILKALNSLSPGSKWILHENSLDKIEWVECKEPPSKEDILNEAKRLQEIDRCNEYKGLRSSEYPSIGDQLDALFKAGLFPEEMAAKIQAVKDKYPKG